MLISGLMILEATLHYPKGASFHTTVKDLLGRRWSFVMALALIFVLYILTYAYISACSSVITHTLGKIITIDQRVAGLIFTAIIALAVWSSTRAVDRLSTILIGGMIITFFMSVGDMFIQVKPDILFDSADSEASYLPLRACCPAMAADLIWLPWQRSRAW
jgi:tryptophan-specific transport protein